jgi:hypothetical protein
MTASISARASARALSAYSGLPKAPIAALSRSLASAKCSRGSRLSRVRCLGRRRVRWERPSLST